jgi:hypothetical protein
MPSDLITNFAKTKNRWLIFFVGILLSIISALVVFSFFKIEKNQKIVSPLKTSIHHLQLETAEVHRWIEKIMETQLQGDIEYVWFQLKLSVDIFREMLEGDDDNLTVTIPDQLAKELKVLLKGLDFDIDEYKTAVTWLLDPKVKSGSTLLGEHDYEHSYSAIQARLDGMENLTDLFLQKDLLFFRKLMVGTIVTCILLAVLVAATFQRFLKQKADDYSALDAA